VRPVDSGGDMIRFWLFIRVALLKIRNEHLKLRNAELEKLLTQYGKALEFERAEHHDTIRAVFGENRRERSTNTFDKLQEQYVKIKTQGET